MSDWNEAKLQEYIDNKIEEDLKLDYKRADALLKKSEITKDVSAMANSAGGLIIYGIAEYESNSDQSHLPERLDPVDRKDFSKERLEHLISNIRPRLHVNIYPVTLSSDPDNHVAYVVDIPQGTTAYQAFDKRYYRRYNFESVAMYDHEISDIRNRRNYIEKLVEFDLSVEGVLVVFRVKNPSAIPALNVAFDFTPDLQWKNNRIPLAFEHGLKSLPPKKELAFFYKSYIDIINSDSEPSHFHITVSYDHPEVNQRIIDILNIDLADYKGALIEESDLKKQTKVLEKTLEKVGKQLEALNDYLQPVSKSTGLALSHSTLKNFQNIADGGELEKLDPTYCNYRVFVEVLGIKGQLALELAQFSWEREDHSILADIDGVDDALVEKLKKYFRVKGM